MLLRLLLNITPTDLWFRERPKSLRLIAATPTSIKTTSIALVKLFHPHVSHSYPQKFAQRVYMEVPCSIQTLPSMKTPMLKLASNVVRHADVLSRSAWLFINPQNHRKRTKTKRYAILPMCACLSSAPLADIKATFWALLVLTSSQMYSHLLQNQSTKTLCVGPPKQTLLS